MKKKKKHINGTKKYFVVNSTGKYSSESGDDCICWSDSCHHSCKLPFINL